MKQATSQAGMRIDDALALHVELADISDTPLMDCQLVLCHLLGVDRSWLYAHGDEYLNEAQLCRYEQCLALRKQGSPVAYLVGHKHFWRMELAVSPATLVPRPETETLIEAALERITAEEAIVVDAGTGSGAIAIAIAMERPAWTIHAVDQSEAALVIAKQNADRWTPGRIEFHRRCWLERFNPASLDAVLCNPPYVADTDPHLANLAAEPRQALASGADGLDDIRVVIAQAAICLAPGGLLFIEHGFEQGESTREIAEAAGFVDVETCLDFNRQPRVLIARRPARDG